MNKIKFPFCLFVLLVVLGACGNKKEKEQELKCVSISKAMNADDAIPITFTGRTKSVDESTLSFKVSGTIAHCYVREGDYVTAGKVIAQIDPRDYQIQLNATTAEYEQIKADAERVIALYNEGNTTAQNYDKARYGLEQITQKLNNHKNQLSDTRLVAPVSGYIKTLFHEAGENIAMGLPFVTIGSAGGVEVEIKVPAKDYLNLNNYSDYSCTFDVISASTFPLEISRVSHEANVSQLYTVRLRFKDKLAAKDVTPGMSTIVTAYMHNENTDAIVIPTNSIVSDSNEQFVFVYNESESTVSKRKINKFFIFNDGKSVVFDGVKAGESVVNLGARHITDGQKVKILPSPSKSNVGGLL